jgi:hypothetical protein
MLMRSPANIAKNKNQSILDILYDIYDTAGELILKFWEPIVSINIYCMHMFGCTLLVLKFAIVLIQDVSWSNDFGHEALY